MKTDKSTNNTWLGLLAGKSLHPNHRFVMKTRKHTNEAHKALKAAQGDTLEAVGPYVAPIDASEESAKPGNLREFIRTSGPTFVLPSDGGTAYHFCCEAGKAAA